MSWFSKPKPEPEPEPTRWQYKKEIFTADLEYWNKLGYAGWELVSVVKEDDGVVGYLKREHKFGILEEEWNRRGNQYEMESFLKRREDEQDRKEFKFLDDPDRKYDEPLSDYEKKRGF